MELVDLNVKIREKTGKSQARKNRVSGLVPAVVYAKDASPVHVMTDSREFVKLLHKQGGNVIINLNLEKGKTKTVIIKDIQFDAIKEDVLHIDFLQIKLTDKVKFNIPIITKGDAECPGVKEGGILEHLLREVEIECLPTDIPKSIMIDVSGLKVGDAVHVSDLTAPKGVAILTGAEKIIALVKFEALEKPEEAKPEVAEEAVAGKEPEVIKKGKPEDEEEEKKEKK